MSKESCKRLELMLRVVEADAVGDLFIEGKEFF
jgi:hypothetical protein